MCIPINNIILNNNNMAVTNYVMNIFNIPLSWKQFQFYIFRNPMYLSTVLAAAALIQFLKKD